MNQAFILSDLHLGGDDGFQMCPKRNQKVLAETIRLLASHQNASNDVHIVLAGDVVDFLAERPNTAFASPGDALSKIINIIGRTSPVWDALRHAVSSGCALTVMIGNHDIELAFPEVGRELIARLGEGRVRLQCGGDALRLGPVAVVHGNEDDTWNFVANKQLLAYAAGDSEIEMEDLVVCGSELVTEVMNPIKTDYPWIDLLKPETSAALPILAVLRPTTILTIPRLLKLYAKSRWRELRRSTDSDDIAAVEEAQLDAHIALARELAGQSDEIAASDLLKPARELWSTVDLAARNLVRRNLRKALRAFARPDFFHVRNEDSSWVQYAEKVLRKEEDARCVIFGHTHIAKSLSVQGGRYINTGTWADLLSLPADLWRDEADPAVFDEFIDDLLHNRGSAGRRLIGTYAHIVHGETDASVQLVRSDGVVLDDGSLMGSA